MEVFAHCKGFSINWEKIAKKIERKKRSYLPFLEYTILSSRHDGENEEEEDTSADGISTTLDLQEKGAALATGVPTIIEQQVEGKQPV